MFVTGPSKIRKMQDFSKFKRYFIVLFCVFIVYGLLGNLIFIQQQNLETSMDKVLSSRGHPEAGRCVVPALGSLGQYNNYINNKQASCSEWVELGGNLGAPDDGKKFLCMDQKFNIDPYNCVVLSFGSNGDFSFEEDASRLGCKVYVFDPTIGLQEHRRSPNIYFYNLGISNYKGFKKIGMNEIPTDFNFTKAYPVDTYQNILEMLGLTNTPIDLIKMDVEMSEIDFFQDVIYNTPELLRNIKQLAVEVHHDVLSGDLGPTSSLQVFWILYQHLRCFGFNIYMSRHGGFFREVTWGREADW